MNKIAILTSVLGFGTYVPAMLLFNTLQERNYSVELYVYEAFFNVKQRKTLELFRRKFHDNVRFAEATMSVSNGFRNGEIDYNTIYEMWHVSGKNTFFVFSGKWEEIVKNYNCKNKFVQNYRIDCTDAPSWKNCESTQNTNWLLGHNGEPPKIRLKEEQLKEKRSFVNGLVHGGGWGIGNQITLPETITNRYKMHMILQEDQDDIFFRNSNMNILFNYEKSYLDQNGNYCIPKVKKILKNHDIKIIDMQKLLCDVDFIISKPGGGTCLDCLNFGIPFVFLNPIAPHEKDNAEYFIKNGLGIYYLDWINCKNRDGEFRKINQNICAYMKNTRFIYNYIEEVLK